MYFPLFEGKRFDLGLYEAGATRTVRFDHPGVGTFLQYPSGNERSGDRLENAYYAVSDARQHRSTFECTRGPVPDAGLVCQSGLLPETPEEAHAKCGNPR